MVDLRNDAAANFVIRLRGRLAAFAATLAGATSITILGAALIGGGIYLLVGWPWTMIYAGIVVIGFGYMAAAVEARGQRR